MKAAPWILSLLVMVPTLRAADTGLYELSEDFRPKKPLQDRIERATLESRSNDNKSYYLRLYRSGSFSQKKDRIGLVVGDKVIRFFANSPGPGGDYCLSAIVDDADLIPQIVQHFKPKVQQRRHPGYRMLVTFTPDREPFALGEPVTAKLRITNVGDTNFTFNVGGRQRGARDNQFAFAAELAGGKMLPDIGDPKHFGGLGGSVTLKPGEGHEIGVDLSKWFAFTQGGTYVVRGSYYMEFIDQDYRAIWEDFACAEFVLKIKG